MENLDLQQLGGLFAVLILIIVLILIALIVYVVTASRRQRSKLDQAYESQGLAPQPARQVAGQVLALVRDEPGADLQVEVDGVQYRQLTEIQDPQVRRKVLGAALELIRFTGAVGEDVGAPTPLEETHSWREDLREDSQADLDRIRAAPVDQETQLRTPPASEEVEEQFLDLLTEMGQTPPPLEKPSIVRALQQRRMPKAVGQEHPRTFVDDIDDIVQRRVQLIPALIGRDLHVRLGPGDSVRFVFEGKEYKELDDVPNMTAQQLIRDAIQEWEEIV
ncbi:MAG: hypothetical protein PVG56_05025 [Anaerolineae bacterium]|jgi:hypothetical protein